MVLYLTRYEVRDSGSGFGLKTKVDWVHSGWKRCELWRSTRAAAVSTRVLLLGEAVHPLRPRAFLHVALY
jgi:hypothetical protein